MLDPALVEVFVRAYPAECARRAANRQRDEARLRKRLTGAQAQVKRLVAAIAAGGQEFVDIREALAEARAEQDAAERALAEIETLAAFAARLEAIPALRERIDRIVPCT